MSDILYNGLADGVFEPHEFKRNMSCRDDFVFVGESGKINNVYKLAWSVIGSDARINYRFIAGARDSALVSIEGAGEEEVRKYKDIFGKLEKKV